MNMEKQTSLTHCQRCEYGFLELEDGTDPEKAYEDEQWSETYVCGSCGATGTYRVDERGDQISETFTGACKSYQ